MAHATEPLVVPPRPLTVKLAKFFDLDKDGQLSAYEYSLIQTYQTFGWELADTRKKKKFDLNSNNLLEPEEAQAYEKSRQQKPLFRQVKIRQ